LLRFLVLSFPLLLLALGAFHFATEALELSVPELPAPYLLGLWVLEALGLVALFLLVRERGLDRWLAGLAASWTAWIFRGPVLVLTAAGSSRLPAGSWWTLVLAWLGLYTVCGLLMAAVAGGLEREPSAPDTAAEAEPVDAPEPEAPDGGPAPIRSDAEPAEPA
jgi:hypothetical protein